ncbi:hypothetical protein, partial [Chimaeribacter arupi]|uniref:hypothetical protein n=1 Tax=Chimaeribacter arupi TaxID=2060066 RepID=UPI0019D4933C
TSQPEDVSIRERDYLRDSITGFALLYVSPEGHTLRRVMDAVMFQFSACSRLLKSNIVKVT